MGDVYDNSTRTRHLCFEAGSRRISRLYENVIFAGGDGDVGDASDGDFLDAEHSSRAAETFITWSPTQNRTRDASQSQVSSGAQEFMIGETQETTSHEYSDTIGRFPHFSFNLHTLRLVKALVEMVKQILQNQGNPQGQRVDGRPRSRRSGHGDYQEGAICWKSGVDPENDSWRRSWQYPEAYGVEGCCRDVGDRDRCPASDPERRRCSIPKCV